ncbi:hypothetical protein ACFPIJ_23815 [Dactylosporangium cerinum]|uniref:PknH-like extracellular domain-containing protein n=1 Tax=Dactylosporangium cerinum TaxID=1434730 RepID=A0ABV9VX06_9ACTN
MRKIFVLMAAVTVALVASSSPAVAASRPRGIADHLMLQAEDLGGSVPGAVEDGLAWPLLPQPCVKSPVPLPVVSRQQAADFGATFRVYENVARYRNSNAARGYVRELKAQLARCGVGGGDNGFDPVADDVYGPDSTLFFGNYDLGDRYVVYGVAATGRYVVVVMMSDARIGAPDPTTLNGLTHQAIARVRT